jgi:heat shock protein HslJ
MSARLVLLATVLLLFVVDVSCRVSFHPSHLSGSLVGKWRVIRLNGQVVIRPPQVTFTKHTFKYAYCNNRIGQYSRSGNKVSFSSSSDPTSTSFNCPDLTPRETDMHQAFAQCKRLKTITATFTVCLDASGKAVLELDKS